MARKTSGLRWTLEQLRSREGWKALRHSLVRWVRRLDHENIPTFLLVFVSGTLLGAIVILHLERGANEQFQSLGDAVWYTLITMTTVGYGDKYAMTPAGRLAALAVAFFGICSVSILTALVSSIFVSKRIREGKGLEEVNLKGHLVVCGWNRHAAQVLDTLGQIPAARRPPLVLVNELEGPEVEELRFKYEDLGPHYVRGNHSSEVVLRRAAIQQAHSAIVLADETGTPEGRPLDERTILASLAIRELGPKVRTCCELQDPENVQHLRRARVDRILVQGQYAGYIMAQGALTPEIAEVVDTLLRADARNVLEVRRPPASMVGRSFGELARALREQDGSLVLGLARQEQKMSLDDVLSGDTSGIDAFIRAQFAKLGEDVGGTRSRVLLNPPDDTEVAKEHVALVLTATRGEAPK